jgi:hypothetical protein
LRVVFFIVLFISTILNSDDLQIESSIFKEVIGAMVKTDNPKVFIYKENNSLQKYSDGLELVYSCSNADVVVISTLKNLPSLCFDKIIFGTKYSHLKDSRVVGAFFWQKGRPNILFYKDRLDKNDIKLDSSFDKYIEK